MKNFENKTLYMANGEELERVRDIIELQTGNCHMGYDSTYGEDMPADKGYLYPTEDESNWFISMEKNEGLEQISIDEFEVLENV